MQEIDPKIPILGFSLILAFIVGKIAHRIHVPKVTGFILVGLILGPSGYDLITKQLHHELNYLSDLALGLILFNIGGEFHRELLKKIGWKMVRYALVYCSFVSLIVFGVSMAFLQLTELNANEMIFFSCFICVVAITAAPPTTLIVIKEYDSKGNLTDHIIVILAIGTVLAIVGSEIVKIAFEYTGMLTATGNTIGEGILSLLWSIFGSILIGTLLGLALSYLEQHEKTQSEILLAVVCTILLGITLAHTFHLEPLLISIFLGFSLVNFSHSGADIHNHIKGVGLSIYALFFILAGSHIDIYKMQAIGLLGFIYIIARTVGIGFSSMIACKLLKEKEIKGQFLGLGLLSHAGAALGIVAKFNTDGKAIVSDTVHAIVSSVFFFEILGPIMLRFSLIKSREVKVGSLIGDASSSATLSLYDMLLNFLTNIGLIHREKSKQTDQNIKTLANHKIYAIDAKANFAEVVKYIDDHHFPIYPVVGPDYKYEGLIDLNELKNIMFDGFLSRFVVARDLIGHRSSVFHDATMKEATEVFNEFKTEALPVIDPESKKLIGILHHKDLILAMRS